MRTRVDFPKAASAISKSVACQATATLLSGSRAYRGSVMIVNNSDSTVYIGYSASVTTNDGIPLSPSAVWTEDRWSGDIYGVVTSGSADIRVLELF